MDKLKLLLKILFFVLALFEANICEAKVVVFGTVVSETRINCEVNLAECKNEVVVISENDFNITCKSERDLVSYRNLAKGCKATAAKTSSNVWKVGAYNELQGLKAGLQAHHVGQKSLMGKLIPGYNQANAPSILVPEIGHVTNMPGIGRVAATRGLGGFTNARQVLARDIFELRRV